MCPWAAADSSKTKERTVVGIVTAGDARRRARQVKTRALFRGAETDFAGLCVDGLLHGGGALDPVLTPTAATPLRGTGREVWGGTLGRDRSEVVGLHLKLEAQLGGEKTGAERAHRIEMQLR